MGQLGQAIEHLQAMEDKLSSEEKSKLGDLVATYEDSGGYPGIHWSLRDRCIRT